MQPVVRGIDVGFGLTKFVTRVGETQIECEHFASLAPIGEDFHADGIGFKRDTVGIPIGGLVYEVGPDVNLATGIFTSRQMHDGYCETPEYLALVRGALRYMKLEQVDLLVLGLPVASYKAKRAALEKRMKGKHELGRGRTAVVDRVKVIAQPQGALIQYGVMQDCMGNLRNARNLVIDPGSRTFDWLVSEGLKMIGKRSHSVPRGMFDVLSAVADGIGKNLKIQYRDYERIDQALRTGIKPKVFGKEYHLAKHLIGARKIADDAVAEMLRYVGDGSDIDNIILVGGGAFFFKPAIEAAFPKHRHS